MGVPDIEVGSLCQYNRWAIQGSRVSISTMGVPGIVVGSQCQYNGCARHGSRESL
ncbi:hypothetical protein DPMN_161804 [Dreissena polymorpha]|uniref:Uncharacterized protein n=1 Tax=Dreissena polymorpha TaxID=45954 RepID=A0A9D4EQJ7_DREPO|nr:hypothetical protein DPMN_161804 [Dreissena polymorpha]